MIFIRWTFCQWLELGKRRQNTFFRTLSMPYFAGPFAPEVISELANGVVGPFLSQHHRFVFT